MADWQVGDLALCVKSGMIDPGPHYVDTPQAGAIYTVRDVFIEEFSVGEYLALDLDGAPNNVSGLPIWAALRFIRITPGAKIEGVEERRRLPVKQDA